MTAIRDRIHSLEQRLENRRMRLREDTEEAKVAATVTARKWLPVAAAAGAGLAALWFTRRQVRSSRGYVPQYAPYGEPQSARRGVRWASLLGIASTAYKFATSPQGQHLIGSLRRRFATRRY